MSIAATQSNPVASKVVNSAENTNTQPSSTKNTTVATTETAGTNGANPSTAANQTEAANKKLSGYEASQQNRQLLNQQILSSSLNLSLKADNQALTLLFKTALEKVQAEFAPSDEQIATPPNKKPETSPYESEVDYSPQATAERIVGFATGFYQAFKERNPNDPEALTKFMEKFSGGVEKGFADAKEILKNIDKLNGKVESDIEETYGLVQKGLKSFQEKIAEAEGKAPTDSETPVKEKESPTKA